MKKLILTALWPLILLGCKVAEDPESNTSGFINQAAIWDKKSISVCFVPNGSNQNQDRINVKRLVEDTWLKHVDLRITGWGDCDARKADISINMIGGSVRARSHVGKYSAYFYPSMTLGNLTAIQSVRSQRYYEFGIVHEFGHALGILHEHQRSDRPALEEWRNCRDNQGISSGTAVGSYDKDSVMNYCTPIYRPVLSPGDIATIKKMYPPKKVPSGNATELSFGPFDNQGLQGLTSLQNKGLKYVSFKIEVDTENTLDCSYDYVLIQDKNGLSQRICNRGTALLSEMAAPVDVTFVSDARVNSKLVKLTDISFSNSIP